jgi:pre-rRNA-processing protein IPI1
MGSSAKKKREKKKDFQVLGKFGNRSTPRLRALQKAKLKVGKTKPKAANHTDTSFRSKGMLGPRKSARKY